MRFVLVLLVVAVLGVTSAAGALQSGYITPSDRPATGQASVITPVLSPKRTPRVMLGTIRDANANAVVASMVPSIPGHACVVVSNGEKNVYELRLDEGFTPASTQKLLVAHTILSLMDADDRFVTAAFAEAAPNNGTIEGNLYLLGGGDPILETTKYAARRQDDDRPYTNFDELADQLVAQGVTSITGAIIGDGSRYDTERSIPTWEARYLDQVSAGPLSGLGVNDGLATFTETEVPSYPGTPAADPPANTAKILTELLRERGVSVAGGPSSGVVPQERVEIAQIVSPPLREVVAQMLEYSDNTTAELLTKEIAVRTGALGTSANGTQAILANLASLGVDTTNLVLNDGSGLDLGNRVTCSALVQVLNEAGANSPLASALPIAGESGTLAQRMVDTPAAGNLRAKTGSLRNVSALAGYVRGDDGRTYTFAYIDNAPGGSAIPAGDAEAQSALGSGLASLQEVEPPAAILPVPIG